YARLIAPYDVTASLTAKNAALQAWQYLQTHVTWPAEGTAYHNPPTFGGGGEYPVFSAKPATLWAAAELYRLTGDNQYQTRFEYTLNSMKNPQLSGYAVTEEDAAAWAIYMSHHANRDPYLTQRARQMVMLGASEIQINMDSHPFYSSNHPFMGFTGWHSFSSSAIAAVKLFRGYYLTGQTSYRDHAWMTPNIELGANPQNRSYLVGVGYNPPLHPLDTSFTDPYAKVIRGGLVPGVTYHLPGFRQPYIAVNQAYYPKEKTTNPTPWLDHKWGNIYPVLRRFTDAKFLIPMAEGTVKEETMNAVSFALMRNANLPTQVSPTPYSTWTRSLSFRGIGFADIPLADVPLLSPARITNFGNSINAAPNAWWAALTPQQIAAIQMPNIPRWLAKLTPIQKQALTPTQIASFNSDTLYLNLLPEQVPLIPVSTFGSIINKYNIPFRNIAWMQQLTLPQLQAIQAMPTFPNWQTNLTQAQKDLMAGTLVDTQPPVIRLSSPQLTIVTRDIYSFSVQNPVIQAWLKGTTATDNVGLVGTVYHDAPYHLYAGTPTKVTFSVTDVAGHTTTATGRIHIVVDQTLPVITMLGSNPYTVSLGSNYVDAGATALDNVDGNITANLLISNHVNTALVGTYRVTYNVSDAAGNAGKTLTRVIHVVDQTPTNNSKQVPNQSSGGCTMMPREQPLDPIFPLIFILSLIWLNKKNEFKDNV
ncbi:MAG: DUF5011 domain-containing protein, partial [Mariprofundaceae bacterium]|nr:DUF5011 domain-containing protein [Mariprofundaceae bacterium]